MWLQGHVNADVRLHMVTLDGFCTTSAPLAGEIEIVGALAADMALANVILGGLSATDVATIDACATPDERRRDTATTVVPMRQTGRLSQRASALSQCSP